MTSKSLFAAFTVASMAFATACNDTNDMPSEPSEEALAFAVGDDEGATTTLSIKEFKVWAYENTEWGRGPLIMRDIIVTRTGINRWQYTPAVEWPQNKVNFYAISPSNLTMHDEWHRFTFNYTNQSQGAAGEAFHSSDVDILASTRIGADQSSGRIRLNFRHILAQIMVYLRTDLPENLDVRVAYLGIAGRAEGTFFWPEENTTHNTGDDSLIDNWTIWNSNLPPFTVFQPEGGAYISLGLETFSTAPNGKFFVPHRLSPFIQDPYIHGSYFIVAYRIVDTESGETVWPQNDNKDRWEYNNDYGVTRLDLKTNTPDGTWYPGRRYRYTITLDIPSRSQPKVSVNIENI